MDELISAAIEALAAGARNKAQQPGYAPDSRYGRMLAELQARAKAQVVQQPPAPVQVAPRPAPVPVQTPRLSNAPPPVAPAPKDTAHDREEANIKRGRIGGSGSLQGLFEDGNSLLRAVVAAEVLAPPIALRENQLWQIRRPNERSI